MRPHGGLRREGAHQLLVRFLLPRLALHLPLGVVPGLLVVALPFEVVRQAAKRPEHPPADLLALQGQPLFEGRAVGQGEALEKVSLAPWDRGLEHVWVTPSDQRLERSHVQPMVAEGVELQAVVRDQQERRVGRGSPGGEPPRSPMAWRRLDRA